MQKKYNKNPINDDFFYNNIKREVFMKYTLYNKLIYQTRNSNQREELSLKTNKKLESCKISVTKHNCVI